MVLVPFLSRSSRHARAVTGTVKRHDVMREQGDVTRLWDYDERGLEGRWPHVLARRAHRIDRSGQGWMVCRVPVAEFHATGADARSLKLPGHQPEEQRKAQAVSGCP